MSLSVRAKRDMATNSLFASLFVAFARRAFMVRRTVMYVERCHGRVVNASGERWKGDEITTDTYPEQT